MDITKPTATSPTPVHCRWWSRSWKKITPPTTAITRPLWERDADEPGRGIREAVPEGHEGDGVDEPDDPEEPSVAPGDLRLPPVPILQPGVLPLRRLFCVIREMITNIRAT